MTTTEIRLSLSQQQRDVLDVARDLPGIRDDGSREQYIVNRLGMSATAYWQHVVRLLDSEAAEAAYPVLVHRLRRQVADRNARRGH